MLPRSAEHSFKVSRMDPRVRRLNAPLSIQGLEQRKADDLLHFEIVLGVCSGGHYPPAFFPSLLGSDVILRALFRITQDLVSLSYLPEATLIASFLIVRMISLREQAIDTIDRLWLCIIVDLQCFVAIDVFSF